MKIVTCNASSIHGINNFGDELLNLIYTSWISAQHTVGDTYHVAVNNYGHLAKNAKKTIADAGMLVFTGGGYFGDDDIETARPVRRRLRAIRNRNVYWGVFKRARQHRVPLAVLGLEVGPLASRLYRQAVRDILRRATRVVVRNEESRLAACELCGDSLRVDVCLDAALTITPEWCLGQSLRGLSRPRPTAGAQEFKIGLHVHRLTDDLDPRSCVNVVRSILATLPVGREPRLVYLHDQRKKGEHPSTAARAERCFREAFPSLAAVPYMDPLRTVAAIGDLDFVVTTKLHVGIVARALGVPVLAIGGHPKILRFYSAIGEEAACRRPQELLEHGLPSHLVQFLHGEGEFDRRIPVGSEFRESANGNESVVKSLLKTEDGNAHSNRHR